MTSVMQESLDTETSLGSSISRDRTLTALRQKWIQSQQLAGVDPENLRMQEFNRDSTKAGDSETDTALRHCGSRDCTLA